MGDYDYRDRERDNRDRRGGKDKGRDRDRDRRKKRSLPGSRSQYENRGRDRERSNAKRYRAGDVDPEFLKYFEMTFPSLKELLSSRYIPNGVDSKLLCMWLKEDEHRWFLELILISEINHSQNENKEVTLPGLKQVLRRILQTETWEQQQYHGRGTDRDWMALVGECYKELKCCLEEPLSPYQFEFKCIQVFEKMLGYLSMKYNMIETKLTEDEVKKTDECIMEMDRLPKDRAFDELAEDVIDYIGKDTLFTCVQLQVRNEGAKWPRERPSRYSCENIYYALAFYAGVRRFSESIGLLSQARNLRNGCSRIRNSAQHETFSSLSDSISSKLNKVFGSTFKSSSLERHEKLNQKGSFLKYFNGLNDFQIVDEEGNEVAEQDIPILPGEIRRKQGLAWWGVEECPLEPGRDSDEDAPMKERKVIV